MSRHVIETFLGLKNAFKSKSFEKVVQMACDQNKWFTAKMIERSVESICENMLDRKLLTDWISQYKVDPNNRKRVGIICAGNIPLVGFYDLLCACMAGHSVTLKPSSKDTILMEFVCQNLDWDIDIVTKIDRYDIDMLIATGSNHTAQSIEQQYINIPSIIRHNRKSVALLTGNETTEDLRKLSDDIFLYFGLGCRNISHLFVPENYDFEPLINALSPYENSAFEQKVVYEKAIAKMLNKSHISAANFLLLEQPYTLETPIGAVSYSNYDQIPILNSDLIQCTVGFMQNPNNVSFGETQKPSLKTPPDNIDVIKFLISH